jgi:hypothetical protein
MHIQTMTYSPRNGWSAPLPVVMDSAATLLLVFAASNMYDAYAPLTELHAAFPLSHIVGCSTAGEISGTQVLDDSLSVAVVQFGATRLQVCHAPITRPHLSLCAGQTIAEQLYRPDLRAILVFADGTGVNGSELVRGLGQVVPSSIPIMGGLAGDGARYERTWVLVDGKPQTHAVTAVGLYGERLQVGHGAQSGLSSFGGDYTVTNAQGNVVYALDGKPALTVYQEVLGELAEGLPGTAMLFPAAMRNGTSDSPAVVRTIADIDERANALIFAAEVPVGARLRWMQAETAQMVSGASDAARVAFKRTLSRSVASNGLRWRVGSPALALKPQPRPTDLLNAELIAKHRAAEVALLDPFEGDTTSSNGAASSATLCLAFSDVNRRLLLGPQCEDELFAAMDMLPANTHMVGFYGYGEIAPAGRAVELHHQTMAVTTIREA